MDKYNIMTQEEKHLLFKDLCARLPYGVICKASHGIGNTDKKHEYVGVLKFVGNCYGVIADYYEDLPHDTGLINNVFYDIEYIKPYLRPISSITEEEERELNGLLPEVYDFTFRIEELLELIQTQKEIPFHYIDWFNEHHFDYRGLISMGLALEAPEGMYRLINSK